MTRASRGALSRRGLKQAMAIVALLTTAVALALASHLLQLSAAVSIALNAGDLILVSVAVHLIDRALVDQDHAREMKESSQRVIDSLVRQSHSLNALEKSGVRRVYSDRDEITEALVAILEDPGTTQLLLGGISLNDFLLDDTNRSLYRAFCRYMAREDTKARLLLVDPTSQGALLRERAEHRFSPSFGNRDRLEDEVRSGIGILEESLNNVAHGRHEYRLYRAVPTYFMFITQTDCFVQPYHFWLRRGRSRALPLIHYRAEPGTQGADLIAMLGGDTHFKSHQDAEPSQFEEMVGHFSWIWNHASISSGEFHTARTRKSIRSKFYAATLSFNGVALSV